MHVTSRAGLFGGPAGASYVASKHGLIGLTRNVAARYGKEGIRCNAVAPGGVATGIISTAMPDDMAEMELWSPVISTAPGTAQPDDLAEVISWLASGESGSVNGAVLAADQGWTAM